MAVTNADILAAVSTRWTAAGLGSVVTGGVFESATTKGASLPYVTVMVRKAGPAEFSNTGTNKETFHERTIIMVLYHNTGAAAMGSIVSQIIDAFHNATLSITGATFHWCRLDEEDGPHNEQQKTQHQAKKFQGTTQGNRMWMVAFTVRYQE